MNLQTFPKAEHARHWTAESDNASAHRLAFDFIAQIETELEVLKISRTAFARRLGVTPASVSQVLNNPQNLTIKTVAKYCRVLERQAGLIVYETDSALQGSGAPVNPVVFKACWQRWGQPHDLWQLAESDRSHANTRIVMDVQINYSVISTATYNVTASTSADGLVATFGSTGCFTASIQGSGVGVSNSRGCDTYFTNAGSGESSGTTFWTGVTYSSPPGIVSQNPSILLSGPAHVAKNEVR